MTAMDTLRSNRLNFSWPSLRVNLGAIPYWNQTQYSSSLANFNQLIQWSLTKLNLLSSCLQLKATSLKLSTSQRESLRKISFLDPIKHLFNRFQLKKKLSSKRISRISNKASSELINFKKSFRVLLWKQGLKGLDRSPPLRVTMRTVVIQNPLTVLQLVSWINSSPS